MSLFCLSTDQFVLTWSAASPTTIEALWNPPGRLQVAGSTIEVDRCMPDYFSDRPESAGVVGDVGPRLHEETSYIVYVRPAPGRKVRLCHEDPVILNGLVAAADGTIHGTVNFGSAAGRSRFDVQVDGSVAASFEVEVFPSKLDYKTDYREMVADVQDVATSLALQYLRSTYQSGSAARARTVGDLDWVLLLRALVDDLELALRQVARSPRRAIVRPMQLRPADRVRRPDSAVRASVRKQSGRGAAQSFSGGLSVRKAVWTRRATPTLDTPEHRWLSAQLRTVRQRLARLLVTIGSSRVELSPRERRQVEDVRRLEQRVSRLEQLEPLLQARGDPPPSLSSQQLQIAPGYREAYRALLMLRSGLRLEGLAVRASTKELHQLYEYWCYLTVVRLLAARLNHPPQLDDLFRIRSSGLRIELGVGRSAEVSFRTATQRIRVRYNPQFSSSDVVLVPQRPDILLTLESQHWPTVHLLLDAKYRRDEGGDYLARYGAPGPPEDALNVLHRYRDAILEVEAGALQPQRTIIEGAVLFPHGAADDYRSSRHWRSLQRIGVGAVPALPSNVSYLDDWIGGVLADAGWSLADRAIQHVARSRYQEYVDAERLTVRLTVVESKDAGDGLASDRLIEPWFDATQLTTAFVCVLVFPTTRHRHVKAYLRPVVGREVHTTGIELRLGEPYRQSFEADLQVADVPSFSTRLALLRSRCLSDLWLRHVAEWRLRDQLEQAGFRPMPLLGSAERDEIWLSIAADARARYDAGGRWVVETGAMTQRVADHDAYQALAGPFETPRT